MQALVLITLIWLSILVIFFTIVPHIMMHRIFPLTACSFVSGFMSNYPTIISIPLVVFLIFEEIVNLLVLIFCSV